MVWASSQISIRTFGWLTVPGLCLLVRGSVYNTDDRTRRDIRQHPLANGVMHSQTLVWSQGAEVGDEQKGIARQKDNGRKRTRRPNKTTTD
ncbi:hypothetical protein BDW75DRAFT_198775 [Aspergillus navahoensis]